MGHRRAGEVQVAGTYVLQERKLRRSRVRYNTSGALLCTDITQCAPLMKVLELAR